MGTCSTGVGPIWTSSTDVMSDRDDIERLYAVATNAAKKDNMTTLRVDFINYSMTDVTVTVTATDVIKYREMLTDTAATLPGGPAVTLPKGSNALLVRAGRFFGFQTKGEVTISNPDPQLVSVVAASDKDPWPQPPPPPPPSMVSTKDFTTRYESFNTVAGLGDVYRAVPFAMAPLPTSLNDPRQAP